MRKLFLVCLLILFANLLNANNSYHGIPINDSTKTSREYSPLTLYGGLGFFDRYFFSLETRAKPYLSAGISFGMGESYYLLMYDETFVTTLSASVSFYPAKVSKKSGRKPLYLKTGLSFVDAVVGEYEIIRMTNLNFGLGRDFYITPGIGLNLQMIYYISLYYDYVPLVELHFGHRGYPKRFLNPSISLFCRL